MKRICVLLLLVFLTVGLFAEGKSEQSTGPVTIDVWSNDAGNRYVTDPLIEKWNETTGAEKGIVLVHKIYGADFNDVMKVTLAGGLEPPIYKLPFGIPQAIEANYIVPMNDFPGAAEVIEEFKDLLVEGTHKIGDQVYRLPRGFQTIFMAYNKELLAKNGFSEPPQTWADLANMSKVVSDNGNGKEFGIIFNMKGGRFTGWNGTSHFTPEIGHLGYDARTGKYRYIDYLPYVETLLQMKEDGSWFPGSLNMDNDTARANFAEGLVAFKMSASWDVGVWTQQFPAKMDWGICHIVNDPNDRYKRFATVGAMYAFSPKALEHQAECMEVMKFFVNNEEHVRALYEQGAEIPVLDKFKEGADMEVVNSIKNWADVCIIDDVGTYPSTPGSYLLLEGDSVNLTFEKIFTGIADAKTALEDLDRRYQAAIDDAVKRGELDMSKYILPDFDPRLY